MLYLKKYFTEGLIQMAILLSLCGVRVDVGLEPYLPLSLHDMILGPTLALTQTEFHNLHNSLENGHRLHPKSMDLDSFFTARRLLGWVHSLDRLQVPHAELETWLVQREPDPLPMGRPDLPSPLERESTGEERDQIGFIVEPRGGEPNTEQGEEISDDGTRSGGPEHHLIGSEPQFCNILSDDNTCLDLEQHWQDLFAVMEPESKDFDMMTSHLDVGSEARHQNSFEANQEVHLMETSLQHSLLGSLSGQSKQEQVLLPLTPTAQLDDLSPAFNNSSVNNLHDPPNHMDLLGEDFSMGLNADNNSNAFNMNLLAPDHADDSSSLQYAASSQNFTDFNVNVLSLLPQEGNDVTQVLLTSPSSVVESCKEQDFRDEDDLHSSLSGLLGDVTLLDDFRSMDLALDEVFSPELAASLEQEGYLEFDIEQQKSDDYSVSDMAARQDEDQPRLPQNGGDEADTDSGLSLDFSHSPTSSCVSEASSYSSSSSSLTHSSSSCMSAGESLLSEDSHDDAAEGSVFSDMEVEVTVKQEEEKEMMGAVGGCYPQGVNKVFPASYKDKKRCNGFHWQKHIYHDHTYNQPWSPDSSPLSMDKMSTKQTKTSLQHDSNRPYNYSPYRQLNKTNVWSRDERRAQALKIPFSNELIVDLPVEEFNNLLTHYQLNEGQITLIRDIRRRGKNKIAAQNCRKKKFDVLLGLQDEVSCLSSRCLWLLREKRETLKKLQRMKCQLGMLYQEVFSRLRDEYGRPLSTAEYLLNFGPNGSVTVASHQQEALLHNRGEKKRKKQKDKKM